MHPKFEHPKLKVSSQNFFAFLQHFYEEEEEKKR